MIETELLRHLISIAVFILLIGLIVVPFRWPLGIHASFSQHVAPYRSAIIYYNLLFTITLPLLLVFFIGWFAPHYHMDHMGNLFLASIILASLLQYLVTVIPETGAWKTKYHRIMAGCSAAFLLPPIVMLIAAESIDAAGKIAAIASLAVMLSIVLMAIISKARHSHLLILQAGYFAAFFGAILVITYL